MSLCDRIRRSSRSYCPNPESDLLAFAEMNSPKQKNPPSSSFSSWIEDHKKAQSMTQQFRSVTHQTTFLKSRRRHEAKTETKGELKYQLEAYSRIRETDSKGNQNRTFTPYKRYSSQPRSNDREHKTMTVLSYRRGDTQLKKTSRSICIPSQWQQRVLQKRLQLFSRRYYPPQ